MMTMPDLNCQSSPFSVLHALRNLVASSFPRLWLTGRSSRLLLIQQRSFRLFSGSHKTIHPAIHPFSVASLTDKTHGAHVYFLLHHFLESRGDPFTHKSQTVIHPRIIHLVEVGWTMRAVSTLQHPELNRHIRFFDNHIDWLWDDWILIIPLHCVLIILREGELSSNTKWFKIKG